MRTVHRPPEPATSAASGLGTAHIVFLIVAAAAPLSAMVGTVPLAFAVGNGAGVPAAFVFAGVTLLCFSAGYAVMMRRTGGTGGFYTGVAQGLGRPAAVAGGLLALLSYLCATIGLAGAFAYFARLVLGLHGIDVRWEVCAALGIAAVAALGYREIAVSARVLAVMMAGEILVLLALDVAVLARHGVTALPAASFTPHEVFGPGLGVALMFAFVSFIGFESASLYGKESRDPRRSVPRATYVAVVLISVFYALTSWVAVGAVGPSRVRAVAGEQLGNLFFGLGADYLGQAGEVALEVLLCTSLFAATLALHSAGNRYVQALAADGVLPAALGVGHPRHGSPHRASVWQTVLAVVVTAAFAVEGLDPYADLATSMLGLGTLGIIVLQALAALSVLGLWRHRGGEHGLEERPGWWRGLVAPLLGFAGLATTVWLVVGNFALMTGSKSAVVGELPWVLLVVGAAGLAYAAWLRGARPARYLALAGMSAEPVVPAAARSIRA
ncbi:APC family permease [Microbispora sp. NPDC049125]|uniref:APC family permease n=1 Tax=Microbispora sp. NPDC049125 TaxID=3154929 RepID=UPI003467C2ED